MFLCACTARVCQCSRSSSQPQVVEFLKATGGDAGALRAAEQQLRNIEDLELQAVRLYTKGAGFQMAALEGNSGWADEAPFHLSSVFSNSGLRSLLVSMKQYDTESTV